MLIRVRCAAGTWRIEVPSAKASIAEVKRIIEAEKSVASGAQTLSADPGCGRPLGDEASLEDCGLASNGSMVYLSVGSEVSLPPPPGAKDDVGVRGAARVKIGADGSIVATEYDDYTSSKGFRPGMAALGDIKKSWTLTDFLEMDDQFNFKVKRQEAAHCAAVSLDAAACVAFQGYVQQLGWRQQRVGFLYGTFDGDRNVTVEAVYEPPQDCGERGFELLDDDRADAVEGLAKLLGLRRVGFIFACPPREEGFVFSGDEAITAALEQLEAADGVAETPFVSVRVTVNDKGEANFEAYQVSLQCMAMVAEGALAPDPDDAAACLVHETFTAVVEGKRAPSVNTNFFLCNVPVKQHASPTFAADFPKEHRMIPQTRDDLKVVLSKAKQQGKPIVDAVADFGVLLFLASFPQIFDDQFMPAVCASVTDRSLPLDEGYGLILYSFAGMDF